MLDWQNALALMLVAAAAVYVGRAAWLAIRAKRSRGCGGCPACPAEKPTDGALVTIEPLGQTHRD